MMTSKELRKTIFDFDRGIRNFPQSEFVRTLFKPPPRGSWKERFSIYGTGYGVRSREAVEEIYELLPNVVGEKRWLKLGGRYCNLYPSKSYNLGDLGKSFPEFLKHYRYPISWYEVARFEREIDASFHMFHRAVEFGRAELSQITETSRFEFQTSCRLFSSSFQVAAAWQERANRPKIRRKNENSLIYRYENVVRVKILSPMESEFLSQLMRRKTLGATVSHSKIDSECLQRFIQFFLAHQLICKIQS